MPNLERLFLSPLVNLGNFPWKFLEMTRKLTLINFDGFDCLELKDSLKSLPLLKDLSLTNVKNSNVLVDFVLHHEVRLFSLILKGFQFFFFLIIRVSLYSQKSC